MDINLNDRLHGAINFMRRIAEDIETLVGKVKPKIEPAFEQFSKGAPPQEIEPGYLRGSIYLPFNTVESINGNFEDLCHKYLEDAHGPFKISDEVLKTKLRQKEEEMKLLEEELDSLHSQLADIELSEQTNQSADLKLEEMKNVVKAYKSSTNTHIVFNKKFTRTKYVEGYVEHNDEFEVFRYNSDKLSDEQISKKYWETIDKLYKGKCKNEAGKLLKSIEIA